MTNSPGIPGLLFALDVFVLDYSLFNLSKIMS